MNERVCPNCGKTMPGTAAHCQCGFIWNEGADMPAPNIVRSASGQQSAVEQLSSPNNPAAPAPEPGSTGALGAADQQGNSMDIELPPLPWENQPRKAEPAKPTPPEPSVVHATDTTDARTAPTPVAAQPAPRTNPPGQTQPNAALLMACPTCEASISRRAQLCPKCHSAPYSNCLICATRLLVNSTACSECGDPEPFTPPTGGDA